MSAPWSRFALGGSSHPTTGAVAGTNSHPPPRWSSAPRSPQLHCRAMRQQPVAPPSGVTSAAWDVAAVLIETSTARTRAVADFRVMLTVVLLSRLTGSISAVL